MRSAPLRRAFAALFAPWFALVTAEPAAVHPCPMHSAVVATQAAAPTAHDHAAMMHHAAASTGTADAPAPAHQCSCPDGCCAAAPVAVASLAPLAWVPEAIRRDAPPRVDFAPPAERAAHSLPFANGPPSSV